MQRHFLLLEIFAELLCFFVEFWVSCGVKYSPGTSEKLLNPLCVGGFNSDSFFCCVEATRVLSCFLLAGPPFLHFSSVPYDRKSLGLLLLLCLHTVVSATGCIVTSSSCTLTDCPSSVERTFCSPADSRGEKDGGHPASLCANGEEGKAQGAGPGTNRQHQV